jgi:hypothetical protein
MESSKRKSCNSKRISPTSGSETPTETAYQLLHHSPEG